MENINATIETIESSNIELGVDIGISDNVELEVYIEPREYKIVGDNVYIPAVFEDAPRWLINTINELTSISLNDGLLDIENLIAELTQIMAQVEEAKNAYQQAIISNNQVDSRINGILTTINSSMTNVDATLRELIATKVTPSEAAVVAANVITTTVNNPSGNNLGSVIASLKNSLTDLNTTMNTNYNLLYSHIDGAVEANSSALDTIYTYVGIDESGNETGSGVLGRINIIEKQSDGVLETYTGIHDVITYNEVDGVIDQDSISLVTTAEPYASWVAAETGPSDMSKRLAHIGDMYLKYFVNDSGIKEFIASYKFIKTMPDTTTPFGTDVDGFAWAKVTSTMSDAAYALALNAVAAASDKVKLFTSTPVAPYKVGDLWVMNYTNNGINYTKMMACKIANDTAYISTDWAEATTTQKDFIDNVYTPKVTSLENQIDNKIDYYFRNSTEGFPNYTPYTTIQKQMRDGDICHFKDTKLTYRYDYTVNTWVKIESADLDAALTKINETNALLDGKITSYYVAYSDLAPTGINGKYWFDFSVFKLKQYQISPTPAWITLSLTTTPKLSKGDLVYIYGSTNESNNIPVRFDGTNWTNITDGAVKAVASKVTALEAKVDNNYGTQSTAISNLTNTVNAAISSTGAESLSSRFEFGSTLTMHGQTYTTGFGLVSNLTTLPTEYTTAKPTSGSEFWIRADKLKFVDTRSKVSPFSIDTSSGVAMTKFNGIVEFSNIKSVPDYATKGNVSQAIDSYNSSSALTSRINVISDGHARSARDSAQASIASVLGYHDFSHMVSYATQGKTIIKGGMIDATLINTDYLVIGKGSNTTNGIVVTKDYLKVFNAGVARVTLGYLG